MSNITSNGDIVDWTLQICNKSDIYTCFNMRAVLTIPLGLELTGPKISGNPQIQVPVGTYNDSNDTWFLGDVAPNTCHTINFQITVTDIDLAAEDEPHFLLSAEIFSSCIESDLTDNVATLPVNIGTDCPNVVVSIGEATTVNSQISIT